MHRLIDLPALNRLLVNAGFDGESAQIIEATKNLVDTKRHGDLDRWLTALESLPTLNELPALNPQSIALNQDSVSVGDPHHCSDAQTAALWTGLQGLKPWRKGPFRFFGIDIDTEWRSDWKWQRLLPHLSPLSHRRVLDVGCGNGYHLWRALGSGADFVIGIDPGLLFNVQFAAMQRYVQSTRCSLLPLTLEQFPEDLGCFDTVLSMGVIYHRRDPLEHLNALAGQLRPGGELVLESLVMPPGTPTLTPEGRYARMRNIGQIPDSETLASWVEQSAFRDIRIVSEATTSLDEQRTTDWMPFESLAESLVPVHSESAPATTTSNCVTPDERQVLPTGTKNEGVDGQKWLTAEGHPAPRRAIIMAKRV